MELLDLFALAQQRRELLNNFNRSSINNAAQQQNILVNRRRALEDLQRAHTRSAPTFTRGLTRRGLETSGIRRRLTDERMGDQFRDLSRTAESFDRQSNAITRQNLQNQTELQNGLADVDAFRSASAQQIASQIRGIT